MHLSAHRLSVSFGTTLGWLFLLPGDVACSMLGLGQTEKRDLIRMLVNSLAWSVLGVIIVALVA